MFSFNSKVTGHQWNFCFNRVAMLRVRQGDRLHEKAPLGNNLRPQQPLNSRALRTNIAIPAQKVSSKE